MAFSEDNLDPVDRLAGDFLERRRRGEEPSVEEYVARHPELEEKIRDAFSAIVLIERYGSVEREPGLPETAAEAAAFSELRELGDFRMIRRIGRGGMGIVFEAEQVSLSRRVALKILPFHSLLSPDHLKRFQLEARAAARLHHPNIVPIYGVGEVNGVHFYAMQFIEGQGLDEVLREIRRLRAAGLMGRGETAVPAPPSAAQSSLVAADLLSGRYGPGPAALEEEAEHTAPREGSSSSVHLPGQTDRSYASEGGAGYFRSVALIGAQVAEALAHAHAAGVLHRDIKPSNLLLDLKGTVWVTDFGLAKAEGAEDLTHSGDIVGTLRYMGPERFKGWSDQRSDLYSLGASLYELLTMRPAFAAQDRATLMREILYVDPPPPRRLDRHIPRDIETIVLKAMEKEPRQRYQSSVELAEDLRRFLDRRPIIARRSSVGERLGLWFRRNTAVASLILFAAALLITMAAVASIAAIRLAKLAGELEVKQGQTVQSLRRAYLEEARARRLGRRIGQRHETLKVLKLAAEIEPGTDLRNEAIAALGLVDLSPVHPEWKFASHPLSAFAFDETLERYAWSDEKGGIHVARTADRAEILALPSAGGDVWMLRFSPDGRRLAEIHGDDLEIWDLESKRRVSLAKGFDRGYLDFLRDRRPLAAAGGRGGTVRLVNLATGEVVRSLDVGGGINGLAFQPHGRLLAVSVAFAKVVQLWDFETGTVVRRLPFEVDPAGVAWHPQGSHLAVGENGMRIHFGDPEAWEERRILEGHRYAVTRLYFSPSGDILASYGYDKRTILWDPFYGAQLLEYPSEPVGFSPDGRRLGFRFLDRAEVFEVARSSGYRRLLIPVLGRRGQDYAAWSTRFSSDGRLLVYRTLHAVHLLKLPGGEEIARLKLSAEPKAALFLEREGLNLVTVSTEEIQLWPIAAAAGTDGRERLRIGPPRSLFKLKEKRDADDWIRLAALQEGGSELVFTHRRHPHVLDLERPQNHRSYAGHPGLASVEISPDGRWIAGGNWHSGTGIPIWDTAQKEPVKVLPAHDSAAMRFSPDSRWLVTSNGFEYRFYRTGGWEEGLKLERYRVDEPPGHPIFSRDGRVLALAHTISLMRLIDPETGREFATLEPPLESVLFEGAFNADGSLLAIGTMLGFFHFWDLRALRQELQALGLDWDLPPYPDPGPRGPEISGADVLREETGPANLKQVLSLDGVRDAARRVTRAIKTGLAASAAAAYQDNVTSRFAQGFVLREQGKHEEAIRTFQELVDRDAQNPDFLNALAWAYLTAPGDLRRPEEALGLSLRAMALIGRQRRPDGTDLLFLALAKSHLQAPAEAREAYDRALAWRAQKGELDHSERVIFETVLHVARRVLGIQD